MSIVQLTFGDAEDLGQRKRTRRELFLEEMEQVVPWNRRASRPPMLAGSARFPDLASGSPQAPGPS